jgi:hypothetical protein
VNGYNEFLHPEEMRTIRYTFLVLIDRIPPADFWLRAIRLEECFNFAVVITT